MVSCVDDGTEGISDYCSISPSITGSKADTKSSGSTITSIFQEVIGCAITIAVEISSLVFSTVIFLSGCKDREKFNYYGLNPSKLTEEQLNLPAIIFFHAIKHNQSGALPIARALQNRKIKNAAYTINVVYNETHPEKHQQEIDRQIRQISKKYFDQGKPCQIIAVGHSLGGIEAMDLALIRQGNGAPIIAKVIAGVTIASRLKVVPAKWPRACHPELQPQVNAVNKAIRSNPSIPFCTIAARRDWKVPSEAVLVAPKNQCHVINNCSHVSVYFMPETHRKAIDFIESINK